MEHQVRLSLECADRVEESWPAPTSWIRVAVNGNFLTKQDLLNKRDEFRLQGGLDVTWSHGDRWRVLYSPDFEQAVKDVNHPHACPGGDPYHYVWNITPYVQPGKNRLRHRQPPGAGQAHHARAAQRAVRGRTAAVAASRGSGAAGAQPARCHDLLPEDRKSCPLKCALRGAAGCDWPSPAGSSR